MLEFASTKNEIVGKSHVHYPSGSLDMVYCRSAVTIEEKERSHSLVLSTLPHLFMKCFNKYHKIYGRVRNKQRGETFNED